MCVRRRAHASKVTMMMAGAHQGDGLWLEATSKPSTGRNGKVSIKIGHNNLGRATSFGAVQRSAMAVIHQFTPLFSSNPPNGPDPESPYVAEGKDVSHYSPCLPPGASTNAWSMCAPSMLVHNSAFSSPSSLLNSCRRPRSPLSLEVPSAKLETLYASLETLYATAATHPALSVRLSIEIPPLRNGRTSAGLGLLLTCARHVHNNIGQISLWQACHACRTSCHGRLTTLHIL